MRRARGSGVSCDRLGVDVRVLAQVGGRVTLAVTGSLLVLLAISVLLIRGLGLN